MSGIARRVRALVAPAEAGAGRRRAARWLGLAVVAGFAVLAARHVDLAGVGAALAAASPMLLVLAMAANVASLAFHSGRWRAVIHAPSTQVHFRDAFAAVVAGFAVGIAVPARAGDLLRAHLLARRAGLSTTALVAASAFDYVLGAAALVPLLALVAVVTPLPPWARRALAALALVAVVGGALAVLLRPRRGTTAHRQERAGIVARLRAGLAAVHEPKAILAAFAWATAGWAAEVAIAVATLAALRLPANVSTAALAVLAGTAANVVAVSPGNAGPFELAAVLALTGLGVAPEPALAFALAYHFVHLAPVAAMGSVVLVREARTA